MILNATRVHRAALVVLPLFALLGACGEQHQPLSIPFSAHYGDAQISCARSAGSVQMTDLRLYVSEIQVLAAADEPVTVSLQSDGLWQQGDLALLDFEDASAGCENGTRITHATLSGQVPAGDYKGLIFSLGVPFERNHGDPLLAEPPLGDSAMHWSWRGGYKFLRAGVRTETDGFWVHLGSTGCEGTINDITGCTSPNRITVVLPDFEPGKHEVAIDLQALFAGIDFDDAEPGDCSSGPAEQQCDAIFAALGLEFETGATTGPQHVFESRARN